MRRRCSTLGRALILLAATLLGVPIHASYILEFSGSVTSVDAALGARFNSLQTLDGVLRIDGTVADSRPEVVNAGRFPSALTHLSANFTGGGLLDYSLGPGGLTEINQLNDISIQPEAILGDAFTAQFFFPTAAPVDGLVPAVFYLFWEDIDGTAFGADSEPKSLSPLVDLSLFERTRFQLTFLNSETNQLSFVLGQTDRFSARSDIPEPTALSLVALGLLGLGIVRGRFRP